MNKEFEVHMLNERGKKHAKRIAEMFDDLLDGLNVYMGESRYSSIVRTKLEEACFFAKKSVAVMEENQE